MSHARLSAPCIQFAANDIALKLNRFSITGLADPNTGCGGVAVANESGIDSGGRHSIEVEGPGLVQQFRFSGINAERHHTCNGEEGNHIDELLRWNHPVWFSDTSLTMVSMANSR
jgi:hypothetical protein